ncbi:MAG: hypothetical protein EBU10_01430 [Alphaproteobacteria bacterium]|jgi:hypothetical protein|nr:hypothetical protein [Alphaproteobacteria bacterium]
MVLVMSNPPNALVVVPSSNLPAVHRNKNDNPLNLVSEAVKFSSKEEMRNRLPDILGRVLARIWIDSEFHEDFSRDPQGTLLVHGVELPDNMFIEFQKPESDRPRIMVYEQKPNSKFKMRVFYLQLVMMAGK